MSLLFMITGSAVKLNKLYTSYLSDKGMVYFVFPHKISENKQLSTADSPMKCDYTYVTSTDSVRVLMSIELKTLVRPSEFVVESLDSVVSSSPVTLMYSEPHGKNYAYRLSASIPYKEWQSIYKSQKPFEFVIVDNEDNRYVYNYKKNEWQEYSAVFEQLFKIIENSK